MIKQTTNKSKSKHAQSEAVGFVIIILIVIIIGTIFLGIFLRNDDKISVEDAEIANFLSASKGYTTECYKDNEPNYRNLEDLTKDCYDKKSIVCPANEDSCSMVNKIYSEMISRFMPAGTLVYYRLSFYYKESSDSGEQAQENPESTEIPLSNNRIIEDITWGDKTKCNTKRVGRSYTNVANGNIILEFEVCRLEV